MLLRKGQNWSVDAIIAVVIFTGVILSFFYITSVGSHGKKTDDFAREAQKIPGILSNSPNTSLNIIVEGDKIHPGRLENFTSLNYRDLKSKLGLRNDFCIHLEDENGYLIFLNETGNISGFGSSRAKVANISCKEA